MDQADVDSGIERLGEARGRGLGGGPDARPDLLAEMGPEQVEITALGAEMEVRERAPADAGEQVLRLSSDHYHAEVHRPGGGAGRCHLRQPAFHVERPDGLDDPGDLRVGAIADRAAYVHRPTVGPGDRRESGHGTTPPGGDDPGGRGAIAGLDEDLAPAAGARPLDDLGPGGGVEGVGDGYASSLKPGMCRSLVHHREHRGCVLEPVMCGGLGQPGVDPT